MIVVCDINEIWRKKPFSALAELTGVVGVAPADWLVARRRQFSLTEGKLATLPVVLPFGWASSTAWLGQRLLLKRIYGKCSGMGSRLRVLVATSPHYLPILDLLPSGTRVVYYASDDYHNYEGWGAVVGKECELVRRADHSVFVSEGLRARAVRDYGVDPTKTSVSMNASEDRFLIGRENQPMPPPSGELPRPIAGVVGGINGRLDFNLLRRCADLPELGTLLLVGPLPADLPTGLAELLRHPKCVSVGRQPHQTIHQWFQCLDVGLIPYVRTEFNRLCSPMRLFDHLASGAPLVATDACDQVKEFGDRIAVCGDADSFTEAVRIACAGRRFTPPPGITWNARAKHLLEIMETLERA